MPTEYQRIRFGSQLIRIQLTIDQLTIFKGDKVASLRPETAGDGQRRPEAAGDGRRRPETAGDGRRRLQTSTFPSPCAHLRAACARAHMHRSARIFCRAARAHAQMRARVRACAHMRARAHLKAELGLGSIAPSWPQEAPGDPKMAPRWPQESPKITPRGPQDGPKLPQGVTKMTPRGPKVAPA